MAVNLTLNNKIFSYPSDGQERGWGEGATDWAVEATLLLSSIFGPGDFVEKKFTLSANFTDFVLSGISFDIANVTGIILSYNFIRGTAPSRVVEKGTLELSYNPDRAANEKWNISQSSSGDICGINFDVTDDGVLTCTDTISANGDGTLYIETVSTLK